MSKVALFTHFLPFSHYHQLSIRIYIHTICLFIGLLDINYVKRTTKFALYTVSPLPPRLARAIVRASVVCILEYFVKSLNIL